MPSEVFNGDEDDVIHYAKVHEAADALQSKYSGKDILTKLLKGEIISYRAKMIFQLY